MMDDLASPLERALIAYNRVERALLRPPLRWLAPGIGAGLLAVAALLAMQIVGQGSGVFTQAGAGLHGTLAVACILLGLGWILRHALAVLALYAICGLQLLLYLVGTPGHWFALESGAALALGALVIEGVVLLGVVLVVRRDSRAG